MTNIDQCYDTYMKELQDMLPNVYPELTHDILHLQRKLQSESISEPHVIFYIEYDSDTNLEQKIYKLREKYSLEVSNTDEKNILKAASRMTVDKIKEIASDTSIISITGEASPVVRS